MHALPPALAALAAWPQFICWYAEPKPEDPEKFNKFPTDWRNGRKVGANEREAWTDWQTAAAAAAAWDRGHGAGVGFVFTAQDPFFFADIDGALVPAASGDGGSQWSPLALSILARFPGAAVEVSHSGKGLHIIGRTALLAHSCRNIPLNLELYTADRFVALTGDRAMGDAGTDHTAALAAYAAEYFPPRAAAATGSSDWTDGPVADWRGPADDETLVQRALASSHRSAAAAFGAAGAEPTFRDLWEANADVLAAKWPGEGSKPYDASSADQSLANHLAFWTGKDCARMERLMRQSALCRDKWDHHSTYLVDTISKAVGFVRSVLTAESRAPVAIPQPPADAPSVETAALHAGREMRATGSEYMFAADQIAHFEGCFYLKGRNEIYVLGSDELLGKPAFDVTFGGHIFLLDPTNTAKTESAWDAYTKSRVYAPVIVSDLCFRPELASGALVVDGKRVTVNSYVPYVPRVLDGDPAPFLDHLRLMLPDPRDYQILLSWMARVVQSPGRKLQWWPVVQGTPGNGKSTLLEIMAYAMGETHTHLVNPDSMAKTGNQFSDWLLRKTFIGIEEVKVEDRRGFLETLKPLVTNRRTSMEGKGTKQFTGDNRANGMILSNWKDGMPIDPNERRYASLFTAQQSEEDKQRDGMTDAYFAEWSDWWRGTGQWAAHGPDYGFAVVTRFLQTYQIAAEFDPARQGRAPRTSSTTEAVTASRGRVEQEILEAIDEGRNGFAGGWVSSTYLDALIDGLRTAVPRTKRRALMQSLGYDWHPALNGGRVNAPLLCDGGKKPRLYVRDGHVALSIEEPSAVAAAYERAQQPGAVDGAAVVAFNGKPS